VPESKSRKKKSGDPAKAAAGGRPPSPGGKQQGNPAWLVPTMITLMVAGLLWIVATYILNFDYPIPGIRAWNLAIGFALVIAGFGLTTRWR